MESRSLVRILIVLIFCIFGCLVVLIGTKDYNDVINDAINEHEFNDRRKLIDNTDKDVIKHWAQFDNNEIVFGLCCPPDITELQNKKEIFPIIVHHSAMKVHKEYMAKEFLNHVLPEPEQYQVSIVQKKSHYDGDGNDDKMTYIKMNIPHDNEMFIHNIKKYMFSNESDLNTIINIKKVINGLIKTKYSKPIHVMWFEPFKPMNNDMNTPQNDINIKDVRLPKNIEQQLIKFLLNDEPNKRRLNIDFDDESSTINIHASNFSLIIGIFFTVLSVVVSMFIVLR